MEGEKNGRTNETDQLMIDCDLQRIVKISNTMGKKTKGKNIINVLNTNLFTGSKHNFLWYSINFIFHMKLVTINVNEKDSEVSSTEIQG